MQEVIDNPERTWNREGLSRNRGISIHLIDTLVLPNATDEWNWLFISEYIDIQEVVKHPYREWNKEGLSQNRGITLFLIDML